MNKLNGILNWSVRVGKLFGIPISLNISLLFFLWPVMSSRRDDPIHALEYVVMVILSVLLHELGHALTAKHFKLRGLSIMLHGFGGFATSSGERDWKQSLIITLAGPGATFALGILCLLTGNFGLNRSTFGTELHEQFWLVYSIGLMNILMGFLNLIPMLPWDGGQALRAILNRRMTCTKSMRAVAHLGLIIGPPMLVYCFATGRGFGGIFAFVGLITSVQTLLMSGGIKFSEVFADRKDARAMAAQRQREVARKEAYLDDVRSRENERADKERLRKLFEVVEGDEK